MQLAHHLWYIWGSDDTKPPREQSAETEETEQDRDRIIIEQREAGVRHWAAGSRWTGKLHFWLESYSYTQPASLCCRFWHIVSPNQMNQVQFTMILQGIFAYFCCSIFLGGAICCDIFLWLSTYLTYLTFPGSPPRSASTTWDQKQRSWSERSIRWRCHGCQRG